MSYAEGVTVETTWNHPFWMQGHGWTEVRDIEPGQRSVTSASMLAGQRTPKLQLASYTGSANTSRWDEASEGTLEVAGNETILRDTKVYNIEVEGTHSYFVTDRDVLVHNYDKDKYLASLKKKTIDQVNNAIENPGEAAKNLAVNTLVASAEMLVPQVYIVKQNVELAKTAIDATGVNGEEAMYDAHAELTLEAGRTVVSIGVAKVLSKILPKTSVASKADVQAGKEFLKTESKVLKSGADAGKAAPKQPYVPHRNLPKDKHGHKVPDSDHPHTQLGMKQSIRTGENYPQTREWGGKGDRGYDGRTPKQDTDWTDHNRPLNHKKPHDHKYNPITGKRD